MGHLSPLVPPQLNAATMRYRLLVLERETIKLAYQLIQQGQFVQAKVVRQGVEAFLDLARVILDGNATDTTFEAIQELYTPLDVFLTEVEDMLEERCA